MRSLFLAHGSPMNALATNDYTRFLNAFGESLNVDAILMISAHWESEKLTLTRRSGAYEMIYEPDKHPRPKFPMSLILKYVVAPFVVGEKPPKKNSPTGPQFIIADAREFEAERTRLIAFLNRTVEIGADDFDGKESHSFGVLNKTQWSNMLYKHLDHHLQQFGA